MDRWDDSRACGELRIGGVSFCLRFDMDESKLAGVTVVVDPRVASKGMVVSLARGNGGILEEGKRKQQGRRRGRMS